MPRARRATTCAAAPSAAAMERKPNAGKALVEVSKLLQSAARAAALAVADASWLLDTRRQRWLPPPAGLTATRALTAAGGTPPAPRRAAAAATCPASTSGAAGKTQQNVHWHARWWCCAPAAAARRPRLPLRQPWGPSRCGAPFTPPPSHHAVPAAAASGLPISTTPPVMTIMSGTMMTAPTAAPAHPAPASTWTSAAARRTRELGLQGDAARVGLLAALLLAWRGAVVLSWGFYVGSPGERG